MAIRDAVMLLAFFLFSYRKISPLVVLAPVRALTSRLRRSPGDGHADLTEEYGQ